MTTDRPGPRARQPDPLKSRAVLIGASTYDTLEALPAVSKNLEALCDLLTDPSIWGLPKSHCEALLDPASPTDVIRAVHRAASAATDALLVYYAGHGLPDGEADLCLALPAADADNIHEAVAYSAIRSTIVHTAIRCYSKVVILDCCYSGRALTGVMSGQAMQIADQARIDGTYLMTATAENRLALAPPGADHTVFTGALIEKLRNGIPGAAALLDMETLFYHVRADLLARQQPSPQQRSRNDGRAIALARNRHTATPATPAPEVRPRTRLATHLEPLVTAKPEPFCRGVVDVDPQQKPELFDAVAARRSHQQVAAIIEMLLNRGQLADAEGLITAVTRLAPADVASIHDILRLLGLTREARQLLEIAASGRPSDVAELASALSHDVPYLLDYAAAEAGTRDEMGAIVSALWVVGLVDEVDRMCERMADRLAPQDVVLLGNEMRDAGRDRIAYMLYSAAPEALVTRSPAELAQLIAAMRNTGPPEMTEAFARSVCTAFGHLAGVSALYANDLSDVVDLTIEHAAETFELERIVRFEEELHAGHFEDLSLRLCARAAMVEPTIRVPALLSALREDGRPIDAMRLLERLGRGAEIEDIVAVVEVIGAAEIRILLFSFADREGGDVERLCEALYASSGSVVRIMFPEFLSHLVSRNRTGDRVLWMVVRRCLPSTLLDCIESLPPADAKRLFLLTLAERELSSLGRILQESEKLDSLVGRLWGTPSTVHETREILNLFGEIHRVGRGTQARYILARMLEPCEPRFLAEILPKLDPDEQNQMIAYLRTEPARAKHVGLLLREWGRVELARRVERGR